MKLLILLTLVSLQLSATGFSQEVTLSVKNAPLEKVFSRITEQTGFSFIYTRQQLKNSKPVNCDVKKTPLAEALAICFSNQPLSFLIEDRYIVIITKPIENVLPPLVVSEISIHGTVVNEKGEPLPGVSILAKISGKGTVSNDKGRFALTGIDEEEVLIITSVGYEKQEVQVKGRTELLVTLSISINSLDETIIRGYYNTTRRLNTGSVGKVSSKEIEIQPVSNPLATLQGRVTGLFITQANGLPGSNFSVRIRGQNSIQNGNSPLYIIDGVPFLNDADRLTQRSGINANSPFNNINPGDIESIEILKDADATAIYGSRGANGVILITTKKGIAGQTSVELTAATGWGRVTRTMDYLNTRQYLQMRREAFANDGVTPSVSDAPDLLLWDTTRYINWKKLLIGNTSASKNIQLRLSGGTSLVSYSVSANYYRESTVFPGDFFDERSSVNFNTRHSSANKRFTALFTTSLARNISNLPSQDLSQFINLPPNMYYPYDDNGKLRWSEAGYSYGNPFNILVQKNKGTTNRLTTSGLLTYQLLPAVKFKLSLGYNDIRFDEAIRFPIAAQDPSLNPKGSATFGNNQVRSWIFEPQAEFTRNLLEKGKLTVLVGTTFNENENNSTLIRGSGYTNDDLINSISGAASVLTSNAFNQYRYQAVFTRLNFMWDKSYLVNLTGRRDGSSRFGPEKRFANFGAIGLGWIFSENNAIQKLLPVLTYGKIRTSYGIAGNDQIGNYQYLDTWTATQYPYQSVPSLRPTRLFNPDYSWEQNKKVELGLELGFNNDKILLVINRYSNLSQNQIIKYNLPAQTGYNDVLRNFPGRVQNKGWEIEIKTTNFNNPVFQWNTAFNFSASRNKLLQFPGLENSTYADTYVIGKSLNVIRGYRYTGLNKDNGVYTFQDVNADGVINFLDYSLLGDTDPRYYGGFQNGIRYKTWELDFLVQFISQKGYDAIYKLQNAIGSFVNQPEIVLTRWLKPGDDTPFERYTQDFNNPAYYPATYQISQSDAALTDASFLRMKNISLAYRFNNDLLRKLRLESCRFYIEGQNLFTYTGYRGFDPEAQNITSLSPLKMFVTGFQIKF
jgi:TonB-linked SusC/RagA family outer membrane protein